MQFSGAGGTFGGEIRPPQNFLPEIVQLFSVLADWTPRGRKSQNTGVLGHFGLGQPLALGEIAGGKFLHLARAASYRKSRKLHVQQVTTNRACGKLPQITQFALAVS